MRMADAIREALDEKEQAEKEMAKQQEDECRNHLLGLLFSNVDLENVPSASASSPSKSPSPSGLSKQECSCLQRPYFERGLSPSIFLLREHDITSCDHFVAVSYCWHSSIPVTDSIWNIQTLDATSSRTRASSRTLSRAISYARAADVGLIWIDQECIEQDDPEAKEVAIHSIDIVYQRSKYPIGLLDSYISSQGQLDALDLALNGKCHEENQIEDLVHVLWLLAGDLWFTRGWILQESTSTGLRMALLVQYNPSLMRSHGNGIVHGEVCFDLSDLAKMSERIYKDVCEDWFFKDEEHGLRARQLNGDVNFATKSRYEDVDMSAELKERLAKATKRSIDICMIGRQKSISESRPYSNMELFRRPQYSAARALEILWKRNTSFTADRIAILGNLCNYDIRIDTNEVKSDDFSFSICALTMALLNGDMSFLPEFADQASGAIHRNRMKSEARFSWLPFWTESLDRLPISSVDEHWCGYKAPKLTVDGLLLKGLLWVVDQKFDFSQPQASFQQQWNEEFNIPPANPARDPKFDYNERGNPRDGQGQEFVRIFFWELLVELWLSDERSLCELLWDQLRQTLGYPRLNHRTKELTRRTAPLSESFKKVIDPSTHLPRPNLPQVSLENPLLDLLNVDNSNINWVIDQVLRHGCVHVGRWIPPNDTDSSPRLLCPFPDAAVGELFYTVLLG